MKTLLAIISCAKFRDRILNCRSTWLHDVPKNLDYRIFVGRECDIDDEDYVHLDVDDSYSGLSQKIKAMCQWAVGQDYDWVHRVDDDVYVHMERLVNAVPVGLNYVGNRRSYLPGMGCSGFSYWLGKQALFVADATPLTDENRDEFWLAKAFELNGIRAYHDARYGLLERDQDFSGDVLEMNVDKNFKVSCPIDELVTLGECKTAEEMHKIHGAFMNKRFVQEMAHAS